MILNNMAFQKEDTSNPLIKWSHNKIMDAFITNKNNPKVKIVIGNVNKTRMGFTKKLSKAKTMATDKAVVNSSTFMPIIR